MQAIASKRSATQSAQESDSLEPSKPVEREISGGQSHSYKITMIPGQYLQVVVAQRGIDVAVALFTPDGNKISEADSEHLIEGSDDAVALAVSEHARERSLLELLEESRADIRQGVDSSLLEHERSLQQQLNAKAATHSARLRTVEMKRSTDTSSEFCKNP